MVKKSVVKKEVQERFKILPDNWIKDTVTGLEWGPSSNAYLNLELAQKYCKDNGGRLPTRQELESILDLTKHDPAIDKTIFKDTHSSYYWTSTKCAWNISCSWCVSFNDGYVDGCNVDYSIYVRPVRASQ